MEGTRPVLVEVQALVSTGFGMAGACPLALITTGLFVDGCPGKGVGMQLYNQDAYVNIAGGWRGTSVDLAVITAIASSFRHPRKS